MRLPSPDFESGAYTISPLRQRIYDDTFQPPSGQDSALNGSSSDGKSLRALRALRDKYTWISRKARKARKESNEPTPPSIQGNGSAFARYSTVACFFAWSRKFSMSVDAFCSSNWS